MLKRLLRPQTGSALIQGMVLAAAVAGLAYVGTKLTSDQKLAQKGLESKVRLEQLHSMIYSILQNKEHCQATFNHASNPNLKTLPLDTTPRSFTKIVTSTGAIPFEINANDPTKVYMNQSIAINSMTVTYPASFSNHAILAINYGKLENTDSNRRTGKGFGSKSFTNSISLKIQRTTAGAFDSCYAVTIGQNENLVKEFCDELGSSSNAATSLFQWDPTSQKCIMKNLKCKYGSVFVGWDSTGNRKCHYIKDWMDVGKMIDTSTTSCPPGSTSVRFFDNGDHTVRIRCN